MGIDLPKLPQTLPKGLTAEQAEKLIHAARHMKYAYTFERARNAALVSLMLFTGLRRQEVANLRLEDVDVGSVLPNGHMDAGDC